MAKKSDIAILATSILLLLNLADVLKAILDAAIQVETFFRINLVRSKLYLASIYGNSA
jgi:hypothetical protein